MQALGLMAAATAALLSLTGAARAETDPVFAAVCSSDAAGSGVRVVDHFTVGRSLRTPSMVNEVVGNPLERGPAVALEAPRCRASDIRESAVRNDCRLREAIDEFRDLLGDETVTITIIRAPSSQDHELDYSNARRLGGLEVAYLFMHPNAFTMDCPETGSDPAPAIGGAQGGWRLRVAGSPETLQSPLSERDYASFAFTDNVRSGDQTYKIDFAIGVHHDAWTSGRSEAIFQRISVTPYLQFNRFGGDIDADDEVNKVFAGVAVRSFFNRDWSFLNDLAIAPQVLTDDSFEALAFGAAVTLPVSLPFDPPGYGVVAESGPFEYYWTLDGVVDVWDVQEPGAAITSEVDQFGRIGAELSAEIVLPRAHRYFGSAFDDATPFFSITYNVRDGLGEDRVDARMFTGELGVRAGDAGRLKVGLSYETGQDLLRLNEQQTWSLDLGVRY